MPIATGFDGGPQIKFGKEKPQIKFGLEKNDLTVKKFWADKLFPRLYTQALEKVEEQKWQNDNIFGPYQDILSAWWQGREKQFLLQHTNETLAEAQCAAAFEPDKIVEDFGRYIKAMEDERKAVVARSPSLEPKYRQARIDYAQAELLFRVTFPEVAEKVFSG